MKTCSLNNKVPRVETRHSHQDSYKEGLPHHKVETKQVPDQTTLMELRADQVVQEDQMVDRVDLKVDRAVPKVAKVVKEVKVAKVKALHSSVAIKDHQCLQREWHQ